MERDALVKLCPAPEHAGSQIREAEANSDAGPDNRLPDEGFDSYSPHRLGQDFGLLAPNHKLHPAFLANYGGQQLKRTLCPCPGPFQVVG